jgi:hypothetical protein
MIKKTRVRIIMIGSIPERMNSNEKDPTEFLDEIVRRTVEVAQPDRITWCQRTVD